MDTKPGRNSLCPCGSGTKYKNCCLNKDLETLPETKQLLKDSIAMSKWMLHQDNTELNEEEKSRAHTIIETSLPYWLEGLPNSSYIVPKERYTAIIATKAVQRDRKIINGLLGIEINEPGLVEIESDKWGRCSYTELRIEIDKYFNHDDINMILSLCVDCINELIDTYIYVSERYHLGRLRTKDLSHYTYYALVDGVQRDMQHSAIEEIVHIGKAYDFDTPAGEKVKKHIRGGDLELWESFIVEAKRALFNEDFAKAIIDAVTSLEIIIYDYLKKYNNTKGISEKDTKENIKAMGLSEVLNVELKKIAPSGSFSEEVLAKAKGAVTIRNRILHDGRRDVLENDAIEAIDSISRLAKRISGLIEDLA